MIRHRTGTHVPGPTRCRAARHPGWLPPGSAVPCPPAFRSGRHAAGRARRVAGGHDLQRKITMNNDHSQAVNVGKYLISPLTKTLENGWFACSVSIRSGRGRGTTDRVVRLTRLFRDQCAAAEYAVQEGLQWIGLSSPSAPRLAA
jgi:hypothetical protein